MIKKLTLFATLFTAFTPLALQPNFFSEPTAWEVFRGTSAGAMDFAERSKNNIAYGAAVTAEAARKTKDFLVENTVALVGDTVGLVGPITDFFKGTGYLAYRLGDFAYKHPLIVFGVPTCLSCYFYLKNAWNNWGKKKDNANGVVINNNVTVNQAK